MDKEDPQLINRLVHPDELLTLLVTAHRAKLQVPLIGIYSQRNTTTYIIYTTPFIIAQTREEQEMLEQKVLRGHIFEPLGEATCEGKIRSHFIEFRKLYIPQTFLAKDNPNPIIYAGESDNDVDYAGTFSFRPREGSEMDNLGEFEAQRIPGALEALKILQHEMEARKIGAP